MKSFNNCPVCKSVLVRRPSSDDKSMTIKFCNDNVHISLLEKDGNLRSLSIPVKSEGKLQVSFQFHEEEIWVFVPPVGVNKGDEIILRLDEITKIPWFEPNTKDIPKLIEKIKMYLLFS